MSTKENVNCSFCGAPQGKDLPMIAGMSGCICPACVNLANQVVTSWSKKKATNSLPKNLLKPTELKEKLDEYVIGQDFAKQTLSVAVYNHFKRLTTLTNNGHEIGAIDKGVEIEKSNVLMVGPTGSGKTLLIRTLAKILEVPFIIADATSLTQAGYVGDDVESVITRLVDAADGNIPLAEWGIVYIDEIDKLARKGESNLGVRDISGEGVQQALLKMVEGAEVTLPSKRSRNREGGDGEVIRTDNILFIAGGAFAGIDELINKRCLPDVASIGFHAELKQDEVDAIEKDKVIESLTTDDLRQFGLIPEFIGRFHVLTMLSKPTLDDLVHILTKPKNALLKQYQQLFAMDNIELEFTDEALLAIAKRADELETGARGLRGILEHLLRKPMYELPSSEYVNCFLVDEDYVNNQGESDYEEAGSACKRMAQG